MKKRDRKFSGTTVPDVSEREKKNQKIARYAASEGIVLLKNEAVLPLSTAEPIALYGAGAGKTVKGGTGSGDVNERESVSIFQGLKDAGFVITNSDWIENYDVRYKAARDGWKRGIMQEAGSTSAPNFFRIYSSHTFSMPEGRDIQGNELTEVNTAVYVVSRIAGEAADRFVEKGDYYLTEHEKEDIRVLCSACENVIVILNTGGQIDVQEILGFSEVKALLYIGQPGMEGGHALADVLTGQVTLGGKLTDTWAKEYADYPNADTFSHQNEDTVTEKYEEGIYVGYRYFDSFDVEPQYPFGFGLSYTDFMLRCADIVVGKEKVDVTVAVENTGTVYSGKEVVQLYGAGLQYRCKAMDFPLDRWQTIIDINMNAVFALAQLAGRTMIEQKSGKIINIASMTSFFGSEMVPAYSASKGGVMQITKALSNEWMKDGVNVNAIAPGYMETKLTLDMKEKNPAQYEEITGRIPAHRWGRAEDLQGTVIFLSSSASDYISGAIIPVDGGYLGK